MPVIGGASVICLQVAHSPDGVEHGYPAVGLAGAQAATQALIGYGVVAQKSRTEVGVWQECAIVAGRWCWR